MMHKESPAPSKEQFVYRVFESIAKDYDRMNTILSFGRHKAWRRFAMEMMRVRPGIPPSMSVAALAIGRSLWRMRR